MFVANIVVAPNPFYTVIFMVLKNNKPVFHSSTGLVAVAKDSTQEGQETMTLEAAWAIAVAAGAI